MTSVPEIAEDAAPILESSKYTVIQQDVDLDIDFAERCIRGATRISVNPLERDVKELHFSCRQMTIKRVKVDKFTIANYEYEDPFDALRIREEYTVHQHNWILNNVQEGLTHKPVPDLRIPMPPRLRIVPTSKITLAAAATATVDDEGPRFESFVVEIQFEMRNVRDGLHWVGLDDGDHRYPHVYTYSNSLVHTMANYVFPCVDSWDQKFQWRISITCPRTLGDLYSPSALAATTNGAPKEGSTVTPGVNAPTSPFSAEEKALDMQVVCSGYMDDSDAPTDDNDHRRKWVFSCQNAVLPRHVGFSIGPFEQVDLSQYRESEQIDKMGASVVSVHGFCLPGRADELRNTCMPLASALDKLSTQFVFYPFESESSSYKVVFVDDLPMNVVDTATLSICSSRLLVAENLIDPLHESTREVVHALASQWLGVMVTPRAQDDIWLIVGGSYFMADWFMMSLWGRNEHRFRLKMAADKVHEMDRDRPSLIFLGGAIEVDADEYEFLKIKAPLVLSILHHRILKTNGRIGVNRALNRVLFDSQKGRLKDSYIDTSQFQRACEKVSHGRLDAFFNQWVYGRGCPTFRITQRFNKKKLVVEMLIVQVQAEEQIIGGTTSSTFMREAKESVEEVIKGEVPLLFTGPMTMRIHEADGTPYEHIVDIKELQTKVEIPYNTKYKRLKRNRRQKERAAASTGADTSGDQDDALLYCLGDVLQSEEEIREWDLADWTKEDDDRMNNEHFEWIRLDKDFEWIAKISFNQPHYMWVSQLQQDNDVIAQAESLQYLLAQQPFKIVSTILVRTLTDTRYFYGLRVIAAHALARCGTADLDWIGLRHLQKAFHEFFGLDHSNMTRSNDFSDMRSYKIQCAIPEAIAQVRDANGRAPDQVKKFFLDALKFNDNSTNEYSDSFYITTLMAGLASSIVAVESQSEPKRISDEDLMAMTDDEQNRFMEQEEAKLKQQKQDAEFQRLALEEIQRFRRIDEWIPSYENQYTTTTLETIKNLMSAKLMTKRLKDFLNYTRPQNSDEVRLKAFDCLIDLGAFTEPAIMSYFIVNFFEESSPYFRCRLWKVIGRGFAEIALQEDQVSLTESGASSGLVLLSTEKTPGERQRAIERRSTIKGIIGMLKERVGNSDELKDVILEAMKSQKVGVEHFMDMLTLCKILYDEKEALTVKLRLPPYWKVEHNGGGRLTFKSKGQYRSKPYTKLDDRWKRPVLVQPVANLKRPSPDSEMAVPEQKRQRFDVEPADTPAPMPIKISLPAMINPSAAAVQFCAPAPPLVPTPAMKRESTAESKTNSVSKSNPLPPVASAPVSPPMKSETVNIFSPSPSPAPPPRTKIIKLSFKPGTQLPPNIPVKPIPPSNSKRPRATESPASSQPQARKKSKVVTFAISPEKLKRFPSGASKETISNLLGTAKPRNARSVSPSTLSNHSTASSVDVPLAQQQKPMKPPLLQIPPPPPLSMMGKSNGPQSAVGTPATPGGSGFKLKLNFAKKNG